MQRGMRIDSKSEIIAVVPIVQVMPAAETRLREIAYLVTLVAKLGKQLKARVLHVGSVILVRQDRLSRRHGIIERRTFFEYERVGGDMRRAELSRKADGIKI